MAAQTTYTASIAHRNIPAKLLETGVTPVSGKFVFTPAVAATYTASCVVLLAKVPNRCTLLDGYVTGEGEGMSDGFSVYINGESVALGSPLGAGDGATSRLSTNLPVEASASAADGNYEYWYVTAQNIAQLTTTETLAYCFYIARDGLDNTGGQA